MLNKPVSSLGILVGYIKRMVHTVYVTTTRHLTEMFIVFLGTRRERIAGRMTVWFGG